MFITEQRLFELKYEKNGKYYGNLLSRIFFEELHIFNESSGKKIDLMVAIQPFFHRKIGEVWQVKFPDSSILLIKADDDKGYFINCWQGDDYSFNLQFAYRIKS